jgi:hypothetical protein
MRIRLLFLLLFLLTAAVSFSQKNEVRIFLKSNKSTFTIKTERCNYVRLTLNQEGDSMKHFITSIQGQLLTSSLTEIALTPAYSKTIKVSNDCFYEKREITYPQNSNPIVFPVGKIDVLSYQSNAADNCLVTGGVLTFIGSLTTLIVAPLVSIDYKTGNINSRRYVKVAAAGLGLGIVSIPLFVFSKEKKFHLKASKDSKGKTWQIIK